MPPEDWEKLKEALERYAERSGANIRMTSETVSRAQTWILGATGVAIIGLGTWLVNSVNQLNVTMMRVVTQNEWRDARQTDLERRFEQHINSVVKTAPNMNERDPR